MKDGVENTEDAPDEARIQATGALRDAFYILGLATLVIAVLYFAGAILAPITLAVLIWFLINAIANGLRATPIVGRAMGEGVSITLAGVVVIGAILGVGQLVVSNLSELAQGLRGLDQKIAGALAGITGWLGLDGRFDIQQEINNLPLERLLQTIVEAVSSTASNTSMVILFVLFLLLDQPFYDAKIRALFPEAQRQDRVRHVLAKISEDTRAYVWIMTVVSVLVGLSTYVIAASFGLKGAAFWGFVAFAFNYIPTIGTAIGVLLPALFGLVQFDDYAALGLMVALLAGFQFVLGNILLPRMTGGRLNLSECVVVLSLLVWGALWGGMGLFLAVPMVMVMAIIFAQFDSTRPVAILLSKTGRVARA